MFFFFFVDEACYRFSMGKLFAHKVQPARSRHSIQLQLICLRASRYEAMAASAHCNMQWKSSLGNIDAHIILYLASHVATPR